MKKLSLIAKGIQFDSFLEHTDHENWAVCSAFLKSERVTSKIDKYFQVHNNSEICNNLNYKGKRFIDLPDSMIIERFKCPYHPNAEILPSEKYINKYGKIFHSSIAWMVSHAIELGYQDIYFFGVDMNQQVEYKKQRDSLFFMLGVCHTLGIKYHIPVHSGINVFNRIYGD